ncbi:MAG: transcriptional regulator, partial [Methylobacter sp.]
MKKTVVIGFVGTQLDSGTNSSRWERWRPTVSLTQHESLIIHRMVLLHDQKHQVLVGLLKSDIAAVSPETEVVPVAMNIADPWDFGQVYAALYDFAGQYPFDAEQEEYWIHITTGTHVAQ